MLVRKRKQKGLRVTFRIRTFIGRFRVAVKGLSTMIQQVMLSLYPAEDEISGGWRGWGKKGGRGSKYIFPLSYQVWSVRLAVGSTRRGEKQGCVGYHIVY